MANNAYVTFASDDNYFMGVLGLYSSLGQVVTQYPLLVLITEQVSQKNREQLEALGVKYKVIPTRYFAEKIEAENRKRVEGSIIEIFNLTEYDNLLFVEPDILLLHGLDFYFDNLPDSYVTVPVSYSQEDEYRLLPLEEITELTPSLMMIKPNAQTYKSLLAKYETMTSIVDLAKETANVYMELSSTYLLHCTGVLKYWEYLPIKDLTMMQFFMSRYIDCTMAFHPESRIADKHTYLSQYENWVAWSKEYMEKNL